MLSENIKTIRKQRGYTQEEVAARLNVSRQTVSKWEKGYSVPDADLLAKLAEIFEIPVSELLGEPEEQPVEQSAIAEQLARVNEQLIIQNRRAKRVWRGVLIALIVLIVVPLIVAVTSFVLFTAHKSERTTVVGSVEFRCTLDDACYAYGVQYNSNYQILTAGGDGYVANHVNVEQYDDANLLAAQLKDWFEERGGTVEISACSGIPLTEEFTMVCQDETDLSTTVDTDCEAPGSAHHEAYEEESHDRHEADQEHHES